MKRREVLSHIKARFCRPQRNIKQLCDHTRMALFVKCFRPLAIRLSSRSIWLSGYMDIGVAIYGYHYIDTDCW